MGVMSRVVARAGWDGRARWRLPAFTVLAWWLMADFLLLYLPALALAPLRGRSLPLTWGHAGKTTGRQGWR